MTCQRCDGLMVEDHFLDMQESFGAPWILGWRCLCCGEIVDPLIQRHRMLQSAREDRLVRVVGQEYAANEEPAPLIA